LPAVELEAVADQLQCGVRGVAALPQPADVRDRGPEGGQCVGTEALPVAGVRAAMSSPIGHGIRIPIVAAGLRCPSGYHLRTMSPALLEIRVSLTDGGSATFEQNEASLAGKILGRVHPDRVFAQPSLVIGGSHHVTSFPTEKIAFVEIRGDELPDWPFGGNLERVVLLNEDEFGKRLSEVSEVSRRELRVAAGEEVTGYALVELLGGARYRMGLHAKALPSSVRAGRLARLFEAPVLHARRGENVACLINLHNAVSLRIYPGMPELPPQAIEADEVVGTQGEPRE
jgi:hypothetical protein